MKNQSEFLPELKISSIQSDFTRVKIRSSQDAADYIRQFYTGDIDIFESSFILLVNNQLETIGFAKISQGGITGTVIDPRIVAHYAVKSLACGVFVAHNHPSGILQPSESDKALTQKIYLGLKLLDIDLHDHVILTSSGHYSFRDNSLSPYEN
jgi:DNA repair protein RadC